MLVLSRERDQNIILTDRDNPADRIVVTVVDIRGEKVRLGFDAPSHIIIDRQEIDEAKKKQRAAGGDGDNAGKGATR